MIRIEREPHEPLRDDHASRVWQFILRNQRYPTIPLAFYPHVSQLHFITSPQGRTNRYLVRGIVRFSSTRTWYIMKTRYSFDATWIPLRLSESNKIDEYITRPIPYNATRTNLYNQSPVSLPRIGLNTYVPDLIRQRITMFDDEEADELRAYEALQPPINEDFPDPEPSEIELEFFAQREAEDSRTDGVVLDRFGRVLSGVFNGHFFINDFST